ncbi:MAG: DNA replication/repair protein RecF [Halanaerobiales bacterium]
MYLEKIMVKNFRNLKDVLLDLNPALNIFIGANGQGKTNLLEAIYFLATADSHRTSIDRELINWQAEVALLQIKLNKKEQEIKISLQLESSNKEVKVNDNPLKKISDLMGNLNVVLFSPEDLQLVKGSPSNRRKFINIEISQVSSYYYYLLKKYEHVLKQRNNLLKDIRENRKKDRLQMLSVWDEQLIKLGSKIIKKRLEVVKKINILARLKQRQITDGTENLYVGYECSLDRLEEENDDIEVIFRDKLVNNRDKEIRRGYTITGPHRDDLILKINDMDIRKYGSQGQQRTTALALKLAELEFMKSETGEYPVLLLDDVFSELDKKRRKTLLEIIVKNIQTFITTTEFREISEYEMDSGYIFQVECGKIKRRKG